MTDNKIHIKVELSRDNSGKLALTTIFDEKAPNFSKDEEGYYWTPTVEEKDFINEAFELLPATKTKISQSKTDSKPAAPKVEKPPVEPEIKNEMEPAIISSVDVEIKKPEETPAPPLEKKEDTAVFEVTTEEAEPNKPEELEPAKKLEDESILVSADADAIDAALKKRREEKDKTIVEADEQTIIDKVLSQKKKGKWGRK